MYVSKTLNHWVMTAALMAAKLEAWAGDPASLASHIPALMTAVEHMASFEAWTGDPLSVRTASSFAVSLTEWTNDPLVRDASDFAASLEAWIGDPMFA